MSRETETFSIVTGEDGTRMIRGISPILLALGEVTHDSDDDLQRRLVASIEAVAKASDDCSRWKGDDEAGGSYEDLYANYVDAVNARNAVIAEVFDGMAELRVSRSPAVDDETVKPEATR